MDNIRIFDLKNILKENDIEVVDFLSNNFEVNYYYSNFKIDKIIKIEERHICRLDLISFENYGTDSHVDVLLKINQISNPFSMEIGDYIVIPNISSVETFYKVSEQQNKTENFIDTKNIFIDKSKASTKDKNRLAYLEKISKAKEVKPTNILRSGEKSYEKDIVSIKFSPHNTKK